MGGLRRRLQAWRAWIKGPQGNQVLGGTVALLMGLMIFLVGIFDPREDAFPSGRVPVFLAGLAFSAAGASILLEALWKGGAGYRIASSFGLLALLALLATPAYLVVGTGKLWTLARVVALGLALAGLIALALKLSGSVGLSKRARALAVAILVMLGTAAFFLLLHDEPGAPVPAERAEPPKVELEPHEAGR